MHLRAQLPKVEPLEIRPPLLAIPELTHLLPRPDGRRHDRRRTPQFSRHIEGERV